MDTDCHAIDIKRVIRRMRGGSQAQLIQGIDDRFYVVKFAGNPQGNRTLINEWFAAELLHTLKVSTPAVVLLRLISGSEAAKDLCFQMGEQNIPVRAGLHLGSACPANPMTTAIFDFLPHSLMHKTKNLGDFAKALVVDTLLAQTDFRQAVFVRESPPNLAFRAYLIDHGMTFGGSAWQLFDSQKQGFYRDPEIYSMINTAAICEEAIGSLSAILESDILAVAQRIPSTWFGPGDHKALGELLTKLQRRKDRLRTLIAQKLCFLTLSRRTRLTTVEMKNDVNLYGGPMGCNKLLIDPTTLPA